MPLTTSATWPDLVAGKKAKASEVEAKFDWLEGSLWPMASGATADVTYDLGGNGKSWRQAWFTSINPTTTASGIAIGKTTADSSSVLDLSAIPKAILMPVVTTVQRNALTPAEGMMVYNSTNSRMERYEGGQWLAMNNPIGFKDKVRATSTNVETATALQVSGSGRLTSVYFESGTGTNTRNVYIIVDSGTSNRVIFGTGLSAYIAKTDLGYNTSGTFAFTTAATALDISYRKSLDIYYGLTAGGSGTQNIAITYEANI
jgi:hypothetical protein